MIPHAGQRGGNAKSRIERPAACSAATSIARLVARRGASHKPRVPDLFDNNLRAMRRDRAARTGRDPFLLERAFADCLERIELVARPFQQALLIGAADDAWSRRLADLAGAVDVVDPGQLFAARARGTTIIEDRWDCPKRRYDLVVAIGTLDTVNDLPMALRLLRAAMRSDSLLIGAMSGGDTLPVLRAAMRAADNVVGEASAHVHPRIEASALSPLLANAGFAMPVVDVDRVAVRYSSLLRLARDLRNMAATNVLTARARRPLLRGALDAAEKTFARSAVDGRTTEAFEILHFAAWTPEER